MLSLYKYVDYSIYLSTIINYRHVNRYIYKQVIDIYIDMARTKGNSTKLVLAKTESNSLRATVPSFIVKTMHLSVGDELDWEIESFKDGIIRITVAKRSGSQNEEKNEEASRR